jgi:hypothetical protein
MYEPDLDSPQKSPARLEKGLEWVELHFQKHKPVLETPH